MSVSVLAHLGHWYETVLYATPMVVIGAILWWSAHKERAAGPRDEAWDPGDDPRWHDDPRLGDD